MEEYLKNLKSANAEQICRINNSKTISLTIT